MIDPKLPPISTWVVLAVLIGGLSWSSPVAAVQVNVEGVQEELLDNVQAYLTIYQRREDPDLTPSQVRRLHNRAPEQIRRALQPLGYYHPTIESTLEQTNGNLVVTYSIEPGPPVKIGELTLRVTGPGRDEAAFRERVEKYPLAVGDVLHQGRYTRAKRDFLSTAHQIGYFDAEFTTHRIRLNPEENRADVELVFETGPRYRFGPVSFENGMLRKSFLKRYLVLEPGEPFNNEELLRQQDIFMNTQYFRQVNIRPRPERADTDHRVPVEIELSPAPRQDFRAGVGYGTNTGPRVRFGYENRRVNRRGHRFKIDAELSVLRSELAARYTVPLKNPRTEELAYFSSLTREDPDPSDSRLGTLGVAKTDKDGAWVETRSIEFRREDFDISTQSDVFTHLVPTWTLRFTETDDPLFPRNGRALTARLRGSLEELASESSFLQARVDARWIQSLSDKSRFLLRGSVGSTSVDDLRELPPTLRFFTGGDESVRGYSYHSLGPLNARGDVIGGEHLLVGSAEVDYEVREKWRVAAFYDLGNGLRDFSDVPDDLKRGLGVGVRWLSPVGPVRVDLGVGLDKPGNSTRIHIVIGPEL